MNKRLAETLIFVKEIEKTFIFFHQFNSAQGK
jgi:hypothetical protein